MSEFKKVNPQDGGCWYCKTDRGELVFSCEFDTYLHVNCLKQALANSDDREAAIMGRELGVTKE